MALRTYVRGSSPPQSHNHLHATLTYVFVGVNSVVFALLLLLVNPFQIFGVTTVEPVAQMSEVQGVSDEAPPVLATPTPSPTIAVAVPTPSPTPVQLKKKSYRVAVYGDSMVDTMGELLEYLDHELKIKYPTTTFGLYNYGVGSENVEAGLARFHDTFSNRSRSYPPISQIHADVIIIGSYAYNPFTPYDRDKHWLTLTKLVQEAQKTGAKVYLLAEIAPVRKEFGSGPNGVNWSPEASYTHSGRIIEQLENAVGLSRALHVPLINVYEASKKEKDFTKYINSSDHIHPSVEGHELTAKMIVEGVAFD